MNEHELQRTLIEAAQWYGFRVAHFRPARTEHGWRTPVEGDAGFVDLVLAHPSGPVFAWELKAASGRLTNDQQAWAEALGGGHVVPMRWNVIRPKTLDEALEELWAVSDGRRRVRVP